MSASPATVRRPRVRSGVLVAVLALAAVLAPAAAAAAAATVVSDETTTPMIQRDLYDYAPSVYYDAAARLYRMWWCGGVAGDYVLHAQSATLAGPFHSAKDTTPHTYDIALRPSTDARAFDHTHTCDPSVIKVGKTWYLYYGGANEREKGAPTRIGLATSSDGVTWKRANRGKAIIVPARDPSSVPNTYGAGQPSITHVGGRFHVVFTDTTDRGGNQINGAGQYVMRSADPLFKDGVEELQAGGFAPYSSTTHTAYSLLEAFSTDWLYSPSHSAFVLSESRTNPDSTKSIRVHLFGPTLTERLASSPVVVNASWMEGTGLVGSLDRQLAAPVSGVQRLEVVRALGGESPFTWRLFPVVAEAVIAQ